MAKEIPVYLFVGFLESGKTKFIQETFEDHHSNGEDGDERYRRNSLYFDCLFQGTQV